MRRLTTGAAMAVLIASAIAGCDEGDDAPPSSEADAGGIGDRCSDSSQCATGLCTGADDDFGTCTMSCTDPLGKEECPAGWRCRRPEDIDQLVCVCNPSGDEVCGDRIDNDCDGHIDDCLTCNGQLVSRNDRLHCGDCDTRCVSTAECIGGECVCGSADPEDCVAGAGEPVCSSDAHCDDGVDCTEDACLGGACVNRIDPGGCDPGESCDPRVGGCTEGRPCINRGCSDDDPCTTFEQCSGFGTCLYVLRDDDGDGVPPVECGGNDCNDGDGRLYPGAGETCDGIDNDCDGRVDETPADSTCGEGGECRRGACMCDDGRAACLVSGRTRCVDLESDEAHCGFCAVSCKAGAECVDGECEDVDECATDSTACPEHSTCGNVVGTYQCVCDQGWVPDATMTGCVDFDECARGTDDCPQVCTNTQGGFECSCAPGYVGDGRTCTDVNECDDGACGDHATCTNTTGAYSCTCDFGYGQQGTKGPCEVVDACQAGVLEGHAWCNGACRDTQMDASHCNGCNKSCGTGGICVNGACACSNSALTYCTPDGCVNLQSSAAHCKSCEHACPSGAGCVAGSCVCPGGTTECGDACVTLGTNAHCSSCTDACPIGATCTSNQCVCPGATPTTCAGRCVDMTTDEAHCGACDDPCPSGATCTGSSCNCPAAAPDTCQNTCVDRQTSEDHCGTCGNACAVVCAAGSCTTATQIAAGDGFSCALFANKRVGCWGLNDRGQVGRGALSNVIEPFGLISVTDVVEIAARTAHACALTSTGVLYCWGGNTFGELGMTSADQPAPVQTRTGVTDVVAGAFHTCVVLTGGAIECAGDDGYGQRGDGSAAAATWTGPASLTSVDKLVSGAYHLCAIKAGKIYCWGYNSNGQLGLGTSGTNSTAPMEVPGLTGVDDIAAGGTHTCALVDGVVYCFGLNSSYQGGGTSTANQVFPTQVLGLDTAQAVYAGGAFSCALQGDVLSCWGAGAQGQLGNGTYTTANGTPQAVGLTGFTAAALGAVHACALQSGDIFCWGDYAGTTLVTDTSAPSPIFR